jgi:hypothetical protein
MEIKEAPINQSFFPGFRDVKEWWFEPLILATSGNHMIRWWFP